MMYCIQHACAICDNCEYTNVCHSNSENAPIFIEDEIDIIFEYIVVKDEILIDTVEIYMEFDDENELIFVN